MNGLDNIENIEWHDNMKNDILSYIKIYYENELWVIFPPGISNNNQLSVVILLIFDSAIKVWINSFNENIDNRKWLQESVSDILTNQNFIDMKAFVQCSGDSQKIKELEIQIRKKTLNVIEEYLVKKNRV